MPAKAKKKEDATKNKKKKGWKKKEKRKQYSHESLEKALQAVKKGMSYRKAAEKFGVPPTSLHRTVKNPHKLKSKSGPSTVLPANLEQDIINWILYRAKRGNPATKTELLDSVQSYIQLEGTKTPFINDRPGRHWYEKFRKRHPEVTLRTPQHLSMIRASVTEEDIRGWFKEIESHLKNKNILNIHASRVFNCDETNIQFVPKSDKVLTETGARNSYKIFDGCEKESLTVLFMYSADGTRAPPMIMFKYKEIVPSNILKNCPVGWGIGNSENGWMTTETFYEYITNIFYPWLVKENIEFPIIVYLDGHSSHVTIPLVSFCKERQIELIALFPNATHIMQPLDIALFHPFKDLWRKTIMKWKAKNRISKLKKEHIPVVLEEALNLFDNEKQIIQNGFKATGLMPFNPDAIEYDVLHKKKKTKKKNQVDQQLQNQESDCQETESMKQHLLTFEKNLSNDVLQTFKEAEASGKWDQGIEKFALFEYWLNIKKAASDDIVKVHPTIKNIEQLSNHKIILLPHPVSDSVTDKPVNDSVLNVNNDMIVIELESSIQDDELHAFVKNSKLDHMVVDCTNKHINNTSSDSLLHDSIDTDNSVSDVFSLANLENLTHKNLNNENSEQENLPETIQNVHEVISEGSNHCEKMVNEEVTSRPTGDMLKEALQKNVECLPKMLSEESEHCEKMVVEEVVTKSASSNPKEFMQKDVECLSNILSERSEHCEKLVDGEVTTRPTGDRSKEALQENVQYYSKILNKESGYCEISKENNEALSNSDNNADQNKSFTKVFTLPTEYLPKKKRVKLEATGKRKLPSVGTSEEWWKVQMEKEQQKKIKQEKSEKRKLLQEQKKKLAEEKRKLQEEMKAIQNKIKNEI